MLCYMVFRTRWGYFALAATDGARAARAEVVRTCLPVQNHRIAERELLRCLGRSAEGIRHSARLLPQLQERIAAYFEGETVDFTIDPPLSLAHLTPFARKVLHACRRIPPGRTATYSDLARRTGHPNAARADGGVMAANPVPLIVPCHRVLRTDGGLGGFSAPGGVATKRRLLNHERSQYPCPD
jgi:methylated-DNA-[protein]-cysteine S-methyltransferase